MEEEEAEERAMLSRRESALEAPDADSPTRVEEAEEVTPLKNSYPSTNVPSQKPDHITHPIYNLLLGGGRGGRGGGDRGSSGGGGGVCYANQKGECNRGSACRFTH